MDLMSLYIALGTAWGILSGLRLYLALFKDYYNPSDPGHKEQLDAIQGMWAEVEKLRRLTSPTWAALILSLVITGILMWGAAFWPYYVLRYIYRHLAHKPD